ncbi:hypothetical protein ACVTW2_000667 [Escherichia coli]
MNGNELNALERKLLKAKYLYPLLSAMVCKGINQRSLANKAGMNYDTVRKMLSTLDHGSIEQWERLNEAVLSEE